jgi:NDP-sugar pyrophosphorylase family protein
MTDHKSPLIGQQSATLGSSLGSATNSVRGIIMAGGRSERMRATNGPVHKALVEVAGRPLLEHNLINLFAAGIDDVVVVVSGNEPAIDAYLEARGARVARRFRGRLEKFIESRPLGNIGAVGALNDGRRDMIVVYVDNLTSIGIDDLLARHRATSAALTIATHTWALRNPFGELEIDGGFVRSYNEKPVRNVRISSGTVVVAPRAAALVPAGHSFGAAELCAAVLAAALPIAAYEHNAHWIDVNDARALSEAETLVRSNPECFAR